MLNLIKDYIFNTTLTKFLRLYNSPNAWQSHFIKEILTIYKS